MEFQISRALFLFCAILALLGIGGIGMFMLINGSIESSYRLVALFLILILSSNIIVDIMLYE
jgi:hypothetical protein